MNRNAQTAADVTALLRARNTLLWIVTREEQRVERAIVDAAASAKYGVVFWDCASGLTGSDGEPINRNAIDPRAALAELAEVRGQRRAYVFRDLHKWTADPILLRQMRSMARDLANSPRTNARSMIVLSPSAEIPPELACHATVIDWPLPEREEISKLLDVALSGLPEELRETALSADERDRAIDAAIGLTAAEAESCYAKSLVTLRKIDPGVVSAEKRRVIAREKVLTWYEPDPRGLAAVGGLENLKTWLDSRRLALGQRARDFGLPAPKGVFLVGVPGCGKSLTAKAVAAAWQVPLLRLDMGALRSKYVGDSEANIRRALAVAETVSPCVLWLDEIEKSLAGSTGTQGDGGVAADALGAILSWMQERAGAVFVVATANDVSALPPELLRKGRFDELFFVDLPTEAERAAIAAAALKSHGRTPLVSTASELGGVDCAAVALETEGFTGAEIAALVPDALFAAFADGEREITTSDVVQAARQVTPLSKTADAAVAEARAVVDAHNAEARSTQVHVYVIKGRIASTDEEAAKAIASDVRDLLEGMKRGIKLGDVAAIREAANRATQLGRILDPSQEEKLSEAVKVARSAARAIVKRVEKEGEDAALVIQELSTTKIDQARFAFLDLDAPAEVGDDAMPVGNAQRFAELDTDEDEEPAAKAEPETPPGEAIAAAAS